MTEWTIQTEQDVPAVVKDILAHCSPITVFALYGDLGAGKTTLIKAMCTALEVKDVTNSPSFAIINNYVTKHGQTISHFDFYRVKDIGELYDIGIEDYIYGKNYCFIEWPEIGEQLLPEETVKLSITMNPDNSRTVTIIN